MVFHVVVAGDEPGRPTVILLPDFPLHWWSWRRQIEDLANAGFRVIAMDLRGMGASDLQPGPVELHDLAEDVISVADATGTTSYTVVGAGLGGSVAWAVAHLRHAGLQSIVTVGAPHPLARLPRPERRARRALRQLRNPFLRRRRLRNGSLVEEILTSWGGPDFAEHLQRVAPEYAADLQRVFAANAALELLRAETPSSASKKLLEGAVGVPVLSVRGAEDSRVGATAFGSDAALSGAAVAHVEIPRAGHFPYEETPAQVTRILVDHLSQFAATEE